MEEFEWKKGHNFTFIPLSSFLTTLSSCESKKYIHKSKHIGDV